SGDIAVGYSISGSSVDPSIAFTGRAASDPAGTLQAETSVVTGTGVQNGTLTRWGDYSAMQVDPVDDCTFWFTTEYMKTTGTFNWNTRIASFTFPNCSTSPSTLPLNVTVAGSANGTVTSSPAGINCPGACSASFASGTTVTLTPTAAAGSTFAGWSGACSGTGTCTVSMSAARSVTATFTAAVTFLLSVTVSGSGSVTSSSGGINCPGTCSANFASGTAVLLTAKPAAGASFSGWSGACTGTVTTCSLSITAAGSVSATFHTPTSTTTALTVSPTPPQANAGSVVTFTARVSPVSGNIA